ncbi:MAG: mechanosensitive ion channel domain-containing protein [Myxococcota bacterium]
MLDSLRELLVGLGLPETAGTAISYLTLVSGVVALSWLANLVTRALLVRGISHVITRTSTDWDDALIKHSVFRRLASLAPAMVIYLFAPAFGEFETWVGRLAFVYMIMVSIRVAESLLDAGSDIYESHGSAREAPIGGYIQLAKIALYIVGAIFAIATLLEREPWGLLTGLGAMSAVLLLVFRDSILGFVASVQLAGNNMIHIGDWIEMPDYGADGDVIELSLHTIKVQNWDKTISTIPTQALISHSFKNWRGMQESGGRRIKRALYIDMSTIAFCDEETLGQFEKFEYMKDYLRGKQAEIDEYNRQTGADTSQPINGRRLTNIGTFRAYVEEYLHKHPKIHKDMTFLVRQLAPTERGLPIEIYVFSNDQVWANYEAIQADIFDHILAVVPLFGLRVYQSPSANDLRGAAEIIASSRGTGDEVS